MKRVILSFAIVVALARQTCGLTPGDLSRVTFQQHVGTQISPELVFRDETDRPFRLGDHFGKQPTILVIGYYRCPMLCSLINDGLIKALQELPASVGSAFQVIDMSIDRAENTRAAAAKKLEYLRQYGRPEAAGGWHCLVGEQHSIAQLADQVGYRYVYDSETRQYAHPSGLVVLTPEGKISRYIFGVNFDAKELGPALVAAEKRQSSSAVSQFLLLCYHYNPITGKYGRLILWILRIGSVGFLAAIAWWIFAMTRRSAGGRAQTS
jgi:protein SCO1